MECTSSNGLVADNVEVEAVVCSRTVSVYPLKGDMCNNHVRITYWNDGLSVLQSLQLCESGSSNQQRKMKKEEV